MKHDSHNTALGSAVLEVKQNCQEKTQPSVVKSWLKEEEESPRQALFCQQESGLKVCPAIYVDGVLIRLRGGGLVKPLAFWSGYIKVDSYSNQFWLDLHGLPR